MYILYPPGIDERQEGIYWTVSIMKGAQTENMSVQYISLISQTFIPVYVLCMYPVKIPFILVYVCNVKKKLFIPVYVCTVKKNPFIPVYVCTVKKIRSYPYMYVLLEYKSLQSHILKHLKFFQTIFLSKDFIF